ncbi:hypothetical protein GCM10010251_67570 [Streptomyces aurantiogriseus]|uniref:Uncharacterized protein n=1 Tax=Streptomyces aurantiogriseus TaxID=66870 RepID=A0A918FJ73_9ACTN|nr:hypothetical protein GCM10010251_67570 [Streptomyces aurantiogriseus]
MPEIAVAHLCWALLPFLGTGMKGDRARQLTVSDNRQLTVSDKESSCWAAAHEERKRSPS